MNLIDRYVSRGVLVSALYGVCVLSFVLVLGNMFKDAMDLLINREVPLGYLLFFMACVLPFSLTFTIPWAFLTAVLLVFGRMSADNETMALRACGVSLARICLPVLGVAVVLCGLTLWLNLAVAPRAEMAIRKSLVTIAQSNPAAVFAANEVVDQFRGRKIFVGAKNGNELTDITIIEQSQDAKPRTVIRARHGELASNQATGELEVVLHRAVVENRPEGREDEFGAIRHGILANEVVLGIPLDDMVSTSLLWRPLRTFQLGELWAFLREDLESKEWPSRVAVRTEISKRFSLALASLAFALLAMPLGIVAQRRETSAGFGLSLVVALGYFLFVALTDALRDNPAAFPYLLVWVPNVLFIGLGTFLLLRLDYR
jgi:lipopolysaccharide export LptBFGC system permease protein LptF